MIDRVPPEMAEALRLTRLGKVVEATALIQRVRRGRQGEAAVDKEAVDKEAESAAEAPEPHAEAHTERPHASLRETVSRVVAMARDFADTRSNLAGEPLPEGATFTKATYANAFGGRDYKLYVPARRARDKPALIVMLHGCTQNPDDFAAGTRMNEIAEEHGFLVAYPAQTFRANMRQCWNWFRPEDQRRGEGEPSLIAGITEEIVRKQGADPKRVYIAGLSAGGAAAAIMGDVYPDLYAGVCVHSGLPSASARDLASAFDAMRLGAKVETASERLVPTIIFHGGKDNIVNPSNADAVAAKAVGNAGALRRETEHGEAPGGRAYIRISYRDEAGRTLCELWRIPEGGHAWSGGSALGSHADPLGPDASREMIRFFFQQ